MFFINCPRLDWLACSYLILAQNQIQRILEYEIYHFWVYVEKELLPQQPIARVLRLLQTWSGSSVPFRSWALRKYAAALDRIGAPKFCTQLKLTNWVPLAKLLLDQHDNWLHGLEPSYGGWTIEAAPTILITEAPFDKALYYGDSGKEIAIISLAHWQRYLAPPSVLEFTLSRVQRYSLRLAFNPALGSHYPTRACIWDFDANVEDTRAGILVGHLCLDCETELAKVLGSDAMDEVKHLLSHKWLGRPDEPGTVSGDIKRIYGYDLARTKGLSRGLRDAVLQSLASEVLKWLVPILLGAIGTWLVWKLR